MQLIKRTIYRIKIKSPEIVDRGRAGMLASLERTKPAQGGLRALGACFSYCQHLRIDRRKDPQA